MVKNKGLWELAMAIGLIVTYSIRLLLVKSTQIAEFLGEMNDVEWFWKVVLAGGVGLFVYVVSRAYRLVNHGDVIEQSITDKINRVRQKKEISNYVWDKIEKGIPWKYKDKFSEVLIIPNGDKNSFDYWAGLARIPICLNPKCKQETLKDEKGKGILCIKCGELYADLQMQQYNVYVQDAFNKEIQRLLKQYEKEKQ